MKNKINKEQLADKAYMIVDCVAFYIYSNDEISIIDLNNLKNKAIIKVVDGGNFRLMNCSFKDKRKYEMLYYMEVNKEILIEGCLNA